MAEAIRILLDNPAHFAGLLVLFGLMCVGAFFLYKSLYFLRKQILRDDFYNYSDDGIVLLDSKGKITNMNRSAMQLLGLPESGNDYAAVEEKISAWKENGTFLRKYNHPESGERVYRVVMSARFGAFSRIRSSVLLIIDETALHEAKQRIRYLEDFDSVTGFASRNCFAEMLESAGKKARINGEKLAVFCVSVAGYDDYCSVYGNRFGDELLREVGSVLRRTCKATGNISRFGNDEFYFFAACQEGRETPTQCAEQLHCCLENRLNAPVVVAGVPITMRLRMGVAFYPEHADDTDRLISMAHLAKLNAGDSPFGIYQNSLGFSSERVLLLSQHMPEAIRQGEFYLVYQPQVRISDRQVIGVEALMRWRSPDLGQVSPAEFIPIAEETGLIRKMGLWVVRQSIRQLAEWRDAGVPLVRISANVSVGQLSEPDFAEKVLKMLAEYRLDPGYLELEMTESISLVPGELTCRQIDRLRDAGVRIAMDDFGMGHSSLAYITQWQFDTIKIDKVFSSQILSNPAANATVRTIQALCDALGSETIVECIEHEEQLPELLRLGCSVVQGYVFSPPLAPKDCVRYIMEHSIDIEPAFAPDTGKSIRTNTKE